MPIIATPLFFLCLATLYDHVSCRVAHGKPPGPNTVLTTAEESMLADWVLDMARIGYGRSFEELRLVVKKMIIVVIHSLTTYLVLHG